VDPRAAKRLERQRRTDEDNIKVLLDMFVPKSEEPMLKKNRLEMIVRHATIWMDKYKSILPYVASIERHNRAGEGSAARTEGVVSQRQGQLVRSSDCAQGFATYVDASERTEDDTTGRTTSGLQKQTILLTHRPN